MSLRIKPYFSLIDKSFRESQTKNYTMSMQLSLYGLVFSVFSEDRNKFIGVEAYSFNKLEDESKIPAQLDLILNERPWFAFPYKRFILLYQNRQSTLIPKVLFQEEKKSLYLGFNQPFMENSRIIYDELPNALANNIYYIPNPVVEKVKEFWPNSEIKHFSSVFIESLLINYKNSNDEKTLFLNLRDNSFDLLNLRDNKLHYYNNYNFRTKEDFIYFLLTSIENLNLNPEEIKLIMLGNINKGMNIYEMIYQYIRDFSFISRNENLQYSFVFNDLQPHLYYSLFNSVQCE
ncbi:MAG: hypothetical protein C0598_04335 [Marinilabiliales bacterium]|nr:MAG: hypothetical protein C0598_04335 [Marinilabiliales bacterium]